MKIIIPSILAFLLFFSFQTKEEKIERMKLTSFQAEVASVDTLMLVLNDTIPNKTIKIYADKNGYPIKYSRDIVTGVCVDGECRLVKINLFWNLTGRYLGFELPKGEFLSKTEHDPFSADEYNQLNELLAEANSPLASYTIEELVPEKDSLGLDVDAVSSATIESILNHIVEGAVYTTYTLWHIVYGPTKGEIERLTENKLDADLSLLVLNSNNLKDQIWVLNHISAKMEISTDLQKRLMELISGKDAYLAERSLNAIKPESINDEIQQELAGIFQNSGFLQKRLIIQKLKESNAIHPEVVEILSSELNSLNGTLTKNVLEMYKIHGVQDSFTVLEVAKLLKNENRYISNQAMSFLENLDDLDKKTSKVLSKYKKRNS